LEFLKFCAARRMHVCLQSPFYKGGFQFSCFFPHFSSVRPSTQPAKVRQSPAGEGDFKPQWQSRGLMLLVPTLPVACLTFVLLF
jgi:hypothetical protein